MFWIEVITNKRSYCIMGGHGSYRVQWLAGEKVISMKVIKNDGKDD
jgi:hypothetical protein